MKTEIRTTRRVVTFDCGADEAKARFTGRELEGSFPRKPDDPRLAWESGECIIRISEVSEPPKFHRIAAGDYETADGVFRLRQLDAGATRAWNVEWTTEFENYLLFDLDLGFQDPKTAYPVDGAATKRDALFLFARWWRKNGHPDPDWRKP